MRAASPRTQVVARPAPASGLTPDEWEVVWDALTCYLWECEGHANVWHGRPKAALFTEDAAKARALLNRIRPWTAEGRTQP